MAQAGDNLDTTVRLVKENIGNDEVLVALAVVLDSATMAARTADEQAELGARAIAAIRRTPLVASNSQMGGFGVAQK